MAGRPGRIRARALLQSDGVCEIKALMRHPMETGQRKDEAGNAIPAHFITEVKASVGDRVLMQSFWGAAVSQNPSIGFRATGLNEGDQVAVEWTDNKGGRGEGKAKVQLADD